MPPQGEYSSEKAIDDGSVVDVIDAGWNDFVFCHEVMSTVFKGDRHGIIVCQR